MSAATAPTRPADESLEEPLETTDLWLLLKDCALDGLRLRIGIEMVGIDKRDEKDKREAALVRLRKAQQLWERWNVFAGEIPRRPPPPVVHRDDDEGPEF